MPDIQHPLQRDLTAGMRRGKIVSIEEAVDLIQDNDVIGFNGIIGIGCPDEIICALEKKFLETGHPRDLTFFYASTLGDGKEMGLQHLAHEGLVKKVIGGHFGKTPKLTQLALDGKIEGYNLPQGVLSVMIRDIAGGRPRTITKVGLGTFVDPRFGGGKLNAVTREDLVEVIAFDGQEYLAYKPPRLNIAIIKATTADLEGNIGFEKEPLYLDALSLATAAKNCGGFVLVQVEGLAERGALPMRSVIIPGALVDCVAVVANAERHRQTAATLYNPAYAHQYRIPVALVPPIPLNERKIIARRATGIRY
jgi:propionate CoA-transferase